jgi:non-canonical poly(A) RNA polymerase PAPD5/7
MDFYSLFKPTDFEDLIRHNLVKRLRDAIQRRWKDADIQPFGSFVAGLYLPTADMDLVFVSNSFLSGYGALYNQKKFLYAFRTFLEKSGFPADGTIELILNAKVPIVKYIDKITGLRVDVSFENNTGLIANRTFQVWKHQYPAMPILVTVIKQFLAMRGLNEPVNGGIGGFSVTCLVVSLLQLMPQVQSGNMIAEHHLGEILMEFFHLYGNEFQAATTAIQLDPPRYVAKVTRNAPSFFLMSLTIYQAYVGTLVYKNIQETKLSIIDPNNPYNDIAGGSLNTATILKAFSQAYGDLSKRMGDLHYTPIAERRGKSILGAILAGNYSSFNTQRDHLRRCHQVLTE